MPQYSIVAKAPHTIVLSDHGIVLGAGVNAVTFVTNHIEDVRRRLQDAGACISTLYLLEQEPSEFRDLLLDGETPRQVLGLYATGPLP